MHLLEITTRTSNTHQTKHCKCFACIMLAGHVFLLSVLSAVSVSHRGILPRLSTQDFCEHVCESDCRPDFGKTSPRQEIFSSKFCGTPSNGFKICILCKISEQRFHCSQTRTDNGAYNGSTGANYSLSTIQPSFGLRFHGSHTRFHFPDKWLKSRLDTSPLSMAVFPHRRKFLVPLQYEAPPIGAQLPCHALSARRPCAETRNV